MADPENRLPPIHPGEILAGNLAEIGLSARAFAADIGVPHNRAAAILRGQRSVTADTALRLARHFGPSARFWLNLQQSHAARSRQHGTGLPGQARQ